MKASGGLTIIEVIIAVFILSVGILAAASMQTTGLRFTNTARAIQEVTNAARIEMELQRNSPQPSCSSTQPTGQTCTVAVTPCWIETGSGVPILTCGATPVGTIVASQVTITVTRSPHAPVVVTTVVTP